EIDLLSLEREGAGRALALHDRQVESDLLPVRAELTGHVLRARSVGGPHRIGENLLRGLRRLAVGGARRRRAATAAREGERDDEERSSEDVAHRVILPHIARSD